ncbi:MAG: M23 family metallopeptidase [Lysobacteraceae bacterium]
MRIIVLSAFLAIAAPSAAHQVEVAQGDIGRWTGGDAVACEFEGKRRDAIAGDCYYPIDFARAPGTYPIARITAQGRQQGALTVSAVDFPEQPIDLPEDMMHYVLPGPAELARIRRESAQITPLFHRHSGAAQFTLPLAAPHDPLPTGKGFGYKRIFNGHPKAAHTGLDYGIGEGQPVNAVADGEVVLTGDHFFTGQAVYVNHGDRLVSEYFHLSEITVTPGQKVKQGELLGKVGGTGRSTGPHLHFGLRWHGMRIDPARMLGDPSALPQVD